MRVASPRTAVVVVLAAAVTFGIGLREARAAAEVDLALVLAIDASGSVSEDRFRLQRQGYAAALENRDFVHAVESGATGRIAVTVVEWSGMTQQAQVVDWTLVQDTASARRLAATVAELPRLFGDSTSIGGAIGFSAQLLAKSGYTAARRVIDVSGDGRDNNGPPAAAARDAAVAAGITINGLPILDIEIGLDAYYSDNVIGGPGAFVTVADDINAFARAIAAKLEREVASTVAPHRDIPDSATLARAAKDNSVPPPPE
jgi:hypothetical protein